MNVNLDKSTLEYAFDTIRKIGAWRFLAFACLALFSAIAIIEIGTPILKSTGNVLAPVWEQALREMIN